MSLPLDHFAASFVLGVHKGLQSVQQHSERLQKVTEAMHGLTGDIRDLEMMMSHYRQGAQTDSNNLAIRFRTAGASVAMQDAAMDLERRLESIRKHVQDLSMHLDL